MPGKGIVSVFLVERKLSAARSRLGKAIKSLASKHKGGEQEEFQAASLAVLQLERELAALKGEEYAVPLNFPIKWDTGAPLPHVVMNDHKVFLTFYVHVPDPKWDGTYVKVVEPGSGTIETLALVEFDGCVSAKLGAPNDEVFCGHPLYGHGLQGYTAQVVENSKWLAGLEEINKVHSGYRPEVWRSLKHYVFWFHDKTFECVASSYKVEVFQESMEALLQRVVKRCL